MEKEKNNLYLNLAIIIIAVCIIFFIGYIVYGKILDFNSSKNNTGVVKKDFYESHKNYDGSYGTLEYFFEENDNINYSISLTGNGLIKMQCSQNDKIENSLILNITNATSLVKLVVPGPLESQKYYILTEDGNIYLYEISKLISKNYYAKKLDDFNNIKKLEKYSYCPKNNAGCTWYILAVDKNNFYKIVDEESV